MTSPASWLFVKGDQSIWVVRPHGFSMIVSGPGAASGRHDFESDEQVQQFQIQMAEELTAGGWMLWGVGRSRRSGRDRRAYDRHVPDRRRRDGDPAASEKPAASRTRTLSDA